MYIKQSIEKNPNNQLKKILINKISTILSGLDFKSDNTIKSKAMKYIAKKYCPIVSIVV